MRIIHLFILTGFWAFSMGLGACAAQAQDKVYNAETFTLENGMQVVVIPNHRVPVVTHMVWYKVGAADELYGQSGIAHFVEHLMFKGSENVPPGEFSTRVKMMGGQDNAFTGQDFTAYFQSVSREHLETVMQMEADRLKGLLFPPEDVKSERLVVIEERRERTENDPSGYFYEQLRAMVFPNHPYGHPIIGWLHEVEALTRENVMAFYNQWYAPNNAILIVSGDITEEELRPMAEEIYGNIPSRAVPERNWTEVPPLLGLPRLVMHHDAIRQPSLQRIYRVPSLSMDKPESLALQVLTNILHSGSATRLYKSLVKEQKLASNISFSYSSSAHDESIIWFYATPQDDIPLADIEKAFDAEIMDIIENGVGEQELAEARTRLKDAAIYARDSIKGPAMLVGRALTTGAKLSDVEYWPRDIDTITAEQVQAVAAKYLHPSETGRRPYVTGHLLPATIESAPENTDKQEAQE